MPLSDAMSDAMADQMADQGVVADGPVLDLLALAPGQGAYDTSGDPILLQQGDTRGELAFTLDPSAAALIATVTVRFCPFAPGLPVIMPGLQGRVLDLSRLSEMPPQLMLFFPAGWGESDLPAGLWKVYAICTYVNGSQETIPLNSLVQVCGDAPLFLPVASTPPPALPSAPLALSLQAYLDAQFTTLRSELMAFNPNQIPEPLVILTATSTLTAPPTNTVYEVKPAANMTTTFSGATGSNRIFRFDISALNGFTWALILGGSDTYDGGANVGTAVSALIASGSAFALRDVAANTWHVE